MFAVSCSVLFLALALARVEGHGRLLHPPGRGTMWRYGWPTVVNFDDNAQFCGGYNYQWLLHGGDCGVCGDPVGAVVKDNEWGGIYMEGWVVEHYSQGQQITIQVQLTANHLGYVEFRLCDTDTAQNKATHACLDQNVLELSDGSGTRFPIYDGDMFINVTVTLPAAVLCDKCMLQWKYHAGNNVDTDPVTGETCKGCGPQEEFYGCSDVKISVNGGTYFKPTTTTLPPTTTTTTTTTTTVATYVVVCADGLYEATDLYYNLDAWCQSTCSEIGTINCESTHCRCRNPGPTASTGPTAATSPTAATNPTVATSTTTTTGPTRLMCVDSYYQPTVTYEAQATMQQWCVDNCFSTRFARCADTHCRCVRPELTTYVVL